MVWQSGSVMDKRVEFVRLAEASGPGMAELCRCIGIPREAGHKFGQRYREGGEAPLHPIRRRNVDATTP